MRIIVVLLAFIGSLTITSTESNAQVSSVQGTQCQRVVHGATIDMCDWGSWRLRQNGSVLLADLADPRKYLICRGTENVNNHVGDITVKVDGTHWKESSSNQAVKLAEHSCMLVEGKKISLDAASLPSSKEAHGFYKLLNNPFSLEQAISWYLWNASPSGTSVPAQPHALFSGPNTSFLRICRSPYLPVAGSSKDGTPINVSVDGSLVEHPNLNRNAYVLTEGNCIDVEGKVLAVRAANSALGQAKSIIAGGFLSYKP